MAYVAGVRGSGGVDRRHRRAILTGGAALAAAGIKLSIREKRTASDQSYSAQRSTPRMTRGARGIA